MWINRLCLLGKVRSHAGHGISKSWDSGVWAPAAAISPASGPTLRVGDYTRGTLERELRAQAAMAQEAAVSEATATWVAIAAETAAASSTGATAKVTA